MERCQLMSRAAHSALASRLGAAPEEFLEPLYVVDELGHVVYWNRALVELTGLRAPDIVGKLSLLLYPAEDVPALLLRRTRALMGYGARERYRTQLRCGRGMMPVELSVATLGSEGKVVGWAMTVRPAPS